MLIIELRRHGANDQPVPRRTEPQYRVDTAKILKEIQPAARRCRHLQRRKTELKVALLSRTVANVLGSNAHSVDPPLTADLRLSLRIDRLKLAHGN